jgi:hypothetical protein
MKWCTKNIRAAAYAKARLNMICATKYAACTRDTKKQINSTGQTLNLINIFLTGRQKKYTINMRTQKGDKDVRNKPKCNHDCFNCPYPDCIDNSGRMTRWESLILKGVFYAWRLEAIEKTANRMLSIGYDLQTICARMGITRAEYGTALKHKKRAARLLAQSSGERKTI